MLAAPARSDEELLTALAEGDLGAMRTLYDRHAPWLSVRLTRRCNDPEVVADVLQDTFVAIWRGAARFKGEGVVPAWMWGIAIRRLVSRLRSRKAVILVAEVAEAGGRASVAAEELALAGVEYGELGPALAGLSPELRAALQATVLDGLTAKEAGRLLGVPANTVKSRLHRARIQLRADLTAKGLT